MALKEKSLFLYGFEVTANNRSIDFRAVFGGPELNATLPLGYYSLTTLMIAIKAALQAADPLRVYTVTANRSYAGGTENRVTITTNGIFFELLFASGSRSSSSVAPLIGFPLVDQTAALTYTGTSSAGTPLVTEYVGYTYVPTTMFKTVSGAVSVSAAGVKEAVVWQVQEFFEVEFKYEPEAKVITEWEPLVEWMIQQRGFEFTPEVSSPNVVIDCTLESSSGDGKGLGFKWKEMLPQFPFNYQTGLMRFRKRNV